MAAGNQENNAQANELLLGLLISHPSLTQQRLHLELF